MTLTPVGVTIWIALLAVIAVVIVPLAVGLLRRALNAARNIEGYLADMLTAGVGVAGNTAAVPALDQTIDWAVAMKPMADEIEAKTGAVAALLAKRAGA
ncbi:MAG: hypothetical protein H0W39_10845 [Sphingomonas sp.]|nr:hypothetical protein [Sphingomonas sp.]